MWIVDEKSRAVGSCSCPVLLGSSSIMSSGNVISLPSTSRAWKIPVAAFFDEFLKLNLVIILHYQCNINNNWPLVAGIT